ncbi:MAG: PucR family transcriptional regulator ligand-binding domain-containing protein [Lachnospiraceae bacterium]
MPKRLLWPTPSFLGNEIILTAFISIKDDVDAQCEAIRRLHAVGEAAIVLYYVDYYMENVDQKLISVANELDFPPHCYASQRLLAAL